MRKCFEDTFIQEKEHGRPSRKKAEMCLGAKFLLQKGVNSACA